MKNPDPLVIQPVPIERFPALESLPVSHGFVARVRGLDVQVDRTLAPERLRECHYHARQLLGLDGRTFVTAEQVHGNIVATVATGDPIPEGPLAGADALVTNRADLCLGIYVADCGPVYLVDPVQRVIGLAHSGRKGTESNITAATVEAMRTHFGTRPEDVVAQLGPCIRPPWYEVDFAAQIVAQAHALGLRRVVDSGTCTAAEPERYYSYRREKGRTGRMLALLALR